ncbi:MAG: T9SS type A sorting domain-containing protein [Bacteroidia bacterium]|nr:T9SS type A sorting domain-containing protein [Bacteroidia bacterium]
MKKIIYLLFFIAIIKSSSAKCGYQLMVYNTTQGTTLYLGNPCGNACVDTLAPIYFNINDSVTLGVKTEMCHLDTSWWEFNGIPISANTIGANLSGCNVTSTGYYKLSFRLIFPWGLFQFIFVLANTPNSVAENNSDIAINIFPNPTSAEVTVHLKKQAYYNVTLQNNIGEIVFQTASNSSELKFDVAGLRRGIYFVRVTDENKNSVVKKLIKM